MCETKIVWQLNHSYASLDDLRLHQPVDVEVLEGTFNDARDLCSINGVVFIAERPSSLIGFIDLEGEITVKPGSLKYRADLLSQLAQSFRFIA